MHSILEQKLQSAHYARVQTVVCIVSHYMNCSLCGLLYQELKSILRPKAETEVLTAS